MGLSAVIGMAGIEERGFNAPPSEPIALSPNRTDSVQQHSATNSIKLNSIPLQTKEEQVAIAKEPQLSSSREQLPSYSPHLMSTLPPITVPTPTPPQEPAQRRRRRRLAMPWRRRLLPAPRRMTAFEWATSKFVAVEHRRLQLEEVRDRNAHEREMERLRLESRRIDMAESRNEILMRLANVANNLTEMLAQSRPSLAPTDISSPENSLN